MINPLNNHQKNINMSSEQPYITINRQSWNNRLESHLTSDFYDVESFLKGRNTLQPIELALLGEVSGHSILHLQCHFGQDTISLGRMGADVTGIDLSDSAISTACKMAEKTQVKADFICCDIYDLPLHLDKQFDIVFTSYGTIGWLPDLEKWAEVIATFLKPGGRFIIVEFHPVVWMFDDNFEEIKYRYFNSGPILEQEMGTYADKTADITQEYVVWNHSLSEVFGSLIRAGMEITGFEEYDYSPYDCFNQTVSIGANMFRIKHLDNKIPMVFALHAIKKNT